MDDVQQLAGIISETLQTIGREFTSLRLLLQFGLLALAAVFGTATATLIRRRVDVRVQMLGWPPLVQTVARLLLANLGTIIFVLVVALMRVAVVSLSVPSRFTCWASPSRSPPPGWSSRWWPA